MSPPSNTLLSYLEGIANVFLRCYRNLMPSPFRVQARSINFELASTLELDDTPPFFLPVPCQLGHLHVQP